MIVIAATIIALIALAVTMGTIARAWSEQRRLGVRLDALATSLATSPAPAERRSALLDALKGERAPGIALPGLDGERVTLDALLATGKPRLLIMVEPRCGPCYEVLPDIGGWQRLYGDRLAIALVSSGAPAINAAMTSPYGITPVLLQHDMEVVTAYGLVQEPAAVLIQPDGRISAGPRYGTHAIRQLVADTLGMVLPPAPAVEATSVTKGEAVPQLRRPDLRGNVIDLAAPRGTPTLLLFWSPGCNHCQTLIPAIQAAERYPRRPEIVIVSRGPAGLTAAVGFSSPVVFDDDRSIARTFGIEATPSAVIIDGHGRVASPVIRGGPGVQGVLERIAATTSEAIARSSPRAGIQAQPDLNGMMP